MGARIVFEHGSGLPDHDWFLAAVPGVGDVGLGAVDLLLDRTNAEIIGRMYHPSLPPHSELDTEGILRPPHMSLHRSTLDQGPTVIFLRGSAQPLTPESQFDASCALLDHVRPTGMLLMLAGLTQPAKEQRILAAGTSKGSVEQLAGLGFEIDGDEPAGGVIGLAGLLPTLAALDGIPSGVVIATTLGTSRDPVASERLAARLAMNLGLGVEIPGLAEGRRDRIGAGLERSTVDHVDALRDTADHLYV